MRLAKFTVLFLLLSFVVVNTANAQVKTKSKNWKSPTFTIGEHGAPICCLTGIMTLSGTGAT